jgi:plasmid stabilization system protein ParE
MRVEYTRRALADLRFISERSRANYGSQVAEALERRIRTVTRHIAEHPLSAPAVEGRAGRHAVPLRRYPFMIFYRVLDDGVRTADGPKNDANDYSWS